MHINTTVFNGVRVSFHLNIRECLPHKKLKKVCTFANLVSSIHVQDNAFKIPHESIVTLESHNLIWVIIKRKTNIL